MTDLIDTNVVSELRKATRAHPGVVRWAAASSQQISWLSAATVLKLEIGVLRMERRDIAQGLRLREWLEGWVLHRFAGRILPVGAQDCTCPTHGRNGTR